MSLNKRVESRPSDYSSLWYEQRDLRAPLALLLHGMTASPGELQPLIEYLHDKGFRVFAPCLCGHGTNVRELESVKASQWLEGVEDAFLALKEQSEKPILLGGISFGALLSLNLLSKYEESIGGTILLAPPLVLKPWWAQLLLFLLTKLPRSSTQSLPSIDKKKRIVHFRFPRFSYAQHSLAALVELLRIQRVALGQKQINSAVLAIFAPKDHLVDFRSVAALRKLVQPRLQLRWLSGAEHEMSVGQKTAKLHSFIDEFLESEGA